jgi:hypothetical protein
MYIVRLRAWMFNKNLTSKDWQRVAVTLYDRQRADKDTASFLFHGRNITIKKLERHIKRRGVSESQFLEDALADGVSASSAIRWLSLASEERDSGH